MPDELIKYVENQYAKGYNSAQIKDMLIRSGYSPSLVDGVMQSVQNRNSVRQEIHSSNEPQSNPHTGKIVFVSMLAIMLIVAGVAFPTFFTSTNKPLLDVKTTQDSESYRIGEDVGFDLEIINMGTKDRFDITLNYRILDSNDILITSKEETIAISTSTSYHKEVKLPNSMKKGTYYLKVFANYEGKLATSAFSFTAEEKASTIVRPETCTDKMKNQDEEGVDCGGICGGYWYDETCNNVQKRTNTTITSNTPIVAATCNDRKTNQNEIGVDCGGICGGYWYDSRCHTNPKAPDETNRLDPNQYTSTSVNSEIIAIRVLARTDPETAKNRCLEFTDVKAIDGCLKVVTQESKNSAYCSYIKDITEKDYCYYPFFMEGDYSVCGKLSLVESKDTCIQLRDLAKNNEDDAEALALQMKESNSLNYFEQ